ncbi:MAG: OmpA family protein [Verrucomicrobiota bacterium]
MTGAGVELHDTPGAPRVLQIRLADWVKYLFIFVTVILIGVVGVMYFQYREMIRIRDERQAVFQKNERLLKDYQKLTLQTQDKDSTIESLQSRLEVVKKTLEEAQNAAPVMSANIFSRPAEEPAGEDTRRLMETLANLFPDLPAYKSGPYVVLQLPGACFDSGATELPPQVLEQMAVIAKVFEFYSGDYFMAVEGHTDATPGASKSNWRIGSERAEKVLDYMIRLGVPPERLALVSRAEYLPMNGLAEGADKEKENRRIELVFAPNRIVKKSRSIATLLQEESQKALHYSSQGSNLPQVETAPQTTAP